MFARLESFKPFSDTMTLVLFTPATEQAVKAYVRDPSSQAMYKRQESKQAYRAGTLRVRRMAMQRRLSLRVDPRLAEEQISV